MRGPELAVIVTTYQMPWHLRRALESIAVQQTSRSIEVVVCDDGSTDETERVVAEFAAAAPFPVRFVTHPHGEFHAARCRNDGVRHSSAPLLLFVDGDCVLPPDHIEQHIEFWRPGTINCGFCARLGPRFSAEIDLNMVRGGMISHWAPAEELKKLRRLHWKSLLYRLLQHPTKPAFRSGNFLISRDDFLRVNGFDEQFQGWGCEDDDLGRRFRAAGLAMRSVLHRTWVCHLWHPPAPSRPQLWKEGRNVAHLLRPIRLTRCLQGCLPLQPEDLTARVLGGLTAEALLRQRLGLTGWQASSDPRRQVDVEFLIAGAGSRFSRRCDCRVLVVLSETSNVTTRVVRRAQVVVSPNGLAGEPRQIRLRLDDAAGLWEVLGGRSLGQERAAA